MEPKYGRDYILWMIEEIGGAAALVKKKGGGAIMAGQNVRHAFVGEMGDVLMYYFDVPLGYGVAAYCEKHDGNMGGDYGNELSRL